MTKLVDSPLPVPLSAGVGPAGRDRHLLELVRLVEGTVDALASPT